MYWPSVVIVHNRYLERGGEDVVFEEESALLESRGHAVTRVEVSNEEVAGMSSASLARSLVWNRKAAERVRRAVVESGAEIAHFHNTLPLISPAAYYGAHAGGAAVVQTLHNYRLLCPGGMLMRNGAPCEDCVGSRVAWRGVVHGCYRGSRVQSAAVALMVGGHRVAGTWRRQVDAYVTLSPFARARFEAGGLPPSRLHVRPNFLRQDPGVGEHGGGFALFAGRLTEQKGVRVLLDAWRRLEGRIPLRIAGDGDLAGMDPTVPGVRWLGALGRSQVLEAMKAAALLVVPSLSYENFPLTVVEAFATGLPVIASRLGSFPHLVRDEELGLLFEAGSAAALARSVSDLWRDASRRRAMQEKVRAEYERAYCAEPGYDSLLAVYRAARARNEAVKRKKG